MINNVINKSKLTQQTVTLKLPQNNILTNRSIKQIKDRVIAIHSKSSMLTNIQTINDKYYDYQFKSTSKNSSISIVPKYPDAFKDSPIKFKGFFKFDKSPKDQFLFEEFKKCIKTGSPLKLESKNFEISHFPEVFSKLLKGSTDLNFKYMELKSSQRNEVYPTRISLLDKEGKSIYNIPYIELKVTQSGEEEVTFSNIEQKTLLKVKFVLNNLSKVAEYSFSCDQEFKSLQHKKEFLLFHLALNKSSSLILSNLKTEQSSVFEIPKKMKK